MFISIRFVVVIELWPYFFFVVTNDLMINSKQFIIFVLFFFVIFPNRAQKKGWNFPCQAQKNCNLLGKLFQNGFCLGANTQRPPAVENGRA